MPAPFTGYAIYNADLGHSSKGEPIIDNPGGAFDDESVKHMQEHVNSDTLVYLDGTAQGAGSKPGEGEDLVLHFTSKGPADVDIIQLDASDFVGNFDLDLKTIQTEDKIYMSGVLSFSQVDKYGNPVGSVYTGSNVDGLGNGGDLNGGEFGDGTYTLSDAAAYEITYIDRNGDIRTITMEITGNSGDTATLALNFICFARDTMLEVQGGHKAVQDLVPGDLVRTKDNGFQPLRWIASRRLTARDLQQNPAIRPIRIRAGALGVNRPERDLIVSPQHRMLLDDWRCQALFGADEMLAPALALINDSSITVDHGADGVDYYHFMFDRHEIVYANNVESESFHPGDFGLTTLDTPALDELFRVFPHLEQDTAAFGAPARPVLRNFEVRAMMTP